MALTKKDKLKKLAQISQAEHTNAKWKNRAKWNRDHEDALGDYALIAQRILDCLKDKGMTQRELAAQLDVTPQALTKIVKGRRNLTLNTIRKIEKVLEIDLISIIHADHSAKQPIITTKVRFASITVYYSREENITKGTQLLESGFEHVGEKKYKLKIA